MLSSVILLFFVVGAWAWLARVPFHEDEAIYAAWALAITRGDWLLWVTPIDKPPLTFYPIAALIGAGARAEWLLRLPSFAWGLLGIWAVGRVADDLGRDKWLARAFLLCSPLWWAMWASAFTDMAAIVLVLLALQSGEDGGVRSEQRGTTGNDEGRQETAGTAGNDKERQEKTGTTGDDKERHLTARNEGRDRLSLAPTFRLGSENAGLATKPSSSWLSRTPEEKTRFIGAILRGMALAGAILAKPTMVLLLPLFLTSPCRRSRISTLERGSTAKKDGFWLSFIGVLLLAWAWDASRVAPSWWRLGTEAYGTLGHIGVDIIDWLRITVGTLGLMVIAYCLIHFVAPSPKWRRESGRGVRYASRGETEFLPLKTRFLSLTQLQAIRKKLNTIRTHPSRLYHAILATALWVPLHILLGFQPWERYLLPLVPLVALLLAPSVPPSAILNHNEDGVVSQPAVLPSPLWRGVGGEVVVPFRPFPSLPFPAVPRSSLLIPLLLLASFLAAPLRFAPQDRRWDDIEAIGRNIEALPLNADVWYADMGRPLAWYAKNAKATLQWGGTTWEQFPGCAANRYIVARSTDTLPASVSIVEVRGQFALWVCDK